MFQNSNTLAVESDKRWISLNTNKPDAKPDNDLCLKKTNESTTKLDNI